ncbi:hypothetical protein KIL84_022296 [Mauremys mutica]|uniref:Uncharacterized protein n=1 Tax=Mauremys mutica TaxID=74926 RepID=A0A9D4B0J1_9SAUR|nr:hypothetical protein KIL84_022296 [Mauremys mutica]
MHWLAEQGLSHCTNGATGTLQNQILHLLPLKLTGASSICSLSRGLLPGDTGHHCPCISPLASRWQEHAQLLGTAAWNMAGDRAHTPCCPPAARIQSAANTKSK